MAAILTRSEDDSLDEILGRLESSFGNQSDLKNLVEGVRSAISNLRSGVALKKTREVAELVIKEESAEVIKTKLRYNFPGSVSIGNVEEILKLIYVGSGAENLKKAIEFVQIVDENLQAGAYKALYEDIKFKKHTDELVMLVLLRKICGLKTPFSAEIKCLVDKDCNKIHQRIAEDITKKDYSLSIYIAKNFGCQVLNGSIEKIVSIFYNGSLEKFLLLIEYSQGLDLHPLTQYFLIDVLLKMLEKHKLNESEQAMHLWAHIVFKQIFVRYGIYEMYKTFLQLEKNLKKFMVHYQMYVEDSSKQKIKVLHESNYLHMPNIVPEFITFYYNGDVSRTQHLLATARAVTNLDATGLMLSHLKFKMTKNSSFETLRLFNEVKRKLNVRNFDKAKLNEKIRFKRLRDKAPPCLRQLLWQDKNTSGFQIVNKFFNATLCAQVGSNDVVCISSSDIRSDRFWKVIVNTDNSLLTLTYARNGQELDFDRSTSTALLATRPAGVKWMVKNIDEHHLKIFNEINGKLIIKAKIKYIINDF